MCVFFCCFMEKNKQEKSRVSKSLIKGAYFFRRKKEDHFFESFLDPQISFARIL